MEMMNGSWGRVALMAPFNTVKAGISMGMKSRRGHNESMENSPLPPLRTPQTRANYQAGNSADGLHQGRKLMQYLVIRISEIGGNPWRIDLDNLAREDSTEKERALTDELEVVTKAWFRQMMRPGSETSHPPIPGSRV